MTPTWILAAVLAQAAEPAAECQRDDNACKARRHERRAKAATTPEDRAYYLHLAHRSYLFSFDKSGDPADLCAARRNFDASLAIVGQSKQQHDSTLAAQKDLLAREGKIRASCQRQDRTPRRPRTSEPPRASRRRPRTTCEWTRRCTRTTSPWNRLRGPSPSAPLKLRRTQHRHPPA